MARPFSLLVNMTTADLREGSATTKHLNAPLSPQCQSVFDLPFCSMPQPSPQKIFLESCFGARSVQLVHSGSTAICGVSISRRVAGFRAGAFGKGGKERGAVGRAGVWGDGGTAGCGVPWNGWGGSGGADGGVVRGEYRA